MSSFHCKCLENVNENESWLINCLAFFRIFCGQIYGIKVSHTDLFVAQARSCLLKYRSNRSDINSHDAPIILIESFFTVISLGFITQIDFVSIELIQRKTSSDNEAAFIRSRCFAVKRF